MTHQGPLHWADGEGWLVLLGGGDWSRGETDLVDAKVLSIANLDRPIVTLFSEGDVTHAEQLIEHYVLLGGPTGEAFSLQKMTKQDLQSPRFLTLLEEAGILYLGGDNPLSLVRSLHRTPALVQILRGFATYQGLILVGAGGGAAALGAWLVSSKSSSPLQHPERGLGFLLNGIVAPHFTTTEEAAALRQILRLYPKYLGLGIPEGTALALGPQGQVETWGTGQVTAIVHTNEK